MPILSESSQQTYVLGTIFGVTFQQGKLKPRE